MPGFFGDQADRLLRKQWTDPMELAQELWAMFNADVPMTTDQPIVQTRNDNNVPAYTINDFTDGSSSPIVINKKDDPPYSCCGNDGGGTGAVGGGGVSGGGGKPPSKDPSKDPFPPPGGAVSPAPPPGGGPEPPKDPNTPYKQFFALVSIRIHQGDPDIFGWDGAEPAFGAVGCFPYKPPEIPGPTDAYDEEFNDPDGTIQEQIDAFMLRWGLDGYEDIGQTITGPGASC